MASDTPNFKPTAPVMDAATMAAHSQDASKDQDGKVEMMMPDKMPTMPKLPHVDGMGHDMGAAWNHDKSSDRFGTDAEKAHMKDTASKHYPGLGSKLPTY